MMSNHSNSLNLSFQGGSQNPDFDYKCEWDVPKYVVLAPVQPRNPDIDIYDDPKYVSMIPDFGYFAKIK